MDHILSFVYDHAFHICNDHVILLGIRLAVRFFRIFCMAIHWYLTGIIISDRKLLVSSKFFVCISTDCDLFTKIPAIICLHRRTDLTATLTCNFIFFMTLFCSITLAIVLFASEKIYMIGIATMCSVHITRKIIFAFY